MDELLKEMERFKDVTTAFTLADVAIVLLLSCALGVALAVVYKGTHRGTSYSQSFAQTLVLMCMVTALIMLIIGSNIARAFSLVGALSVIRFRNAVKETRDVGFMFIVMAMGMACGTRFYLLAAVATSIMSAVLIVMYKLDAFRHRVAERILRVRLPAGAAYETLFEPILREFLSDHRLISVETVAGGALDEVVYSVVLRKEDRGQAFLGQLRKANGNNKALLVIGQQEVDL